MGSHLYKTQSEAKKTMNRYKEFTPSMKVILWAAVVLTLIGLVCLFLAMNPINPFWGRFLIGSAISMPLAAMLIIILTAKIQAMDKEK